MKGIGVWSFVVGLILAIVLAIFTATSPPTWAFFVLAVLGLLVGLLNVQDKEIQPFLVASIAFLLSAQALSAVISNLAFGWAAVSTFFDFMVVFFAPAAAIVALIALMHLAKN